MDSLEAIDNGLSKTYNDSINRKIDSLKITLVVLSIISLLAIIFSLSVGFGLSFGIRKFKNFTLKVTVPIFVSLAIFILEFILITGLICRCSFLNKKIIKKEDIKEAFEEFEGIFNELQEKAKKEENIKIDFNLDIMPILNIFHKRNMHYMMDVLIRDLKENGYIDKETVYNSKKEKYEEAYKADDEKVLSDLLGFFEYQIHAQGKENYCNMAERYYKIYEKRALKDPDYLSDDDAY